MTRRRKPRRPPEPESKAIVLAAGLQLSPFLETELAELEAVIGESAGGEANVRDREPKRRTHNTTRRSDER